MKNHNTKKTLNPPNEYDEIDEEVAEELFKTIKNLKSLLALLLDRQFLPVIMKRENEEQLEITTLRLELLFLKKDKQLFKEMVETIYQQIKVDLENSWLSKRIPETCPYSLTQILDPNFLPEING